MTVTFAIMSDKSVTEDKELVNLSQVTQFASYRLSWKKRDPSPDAHFYLKPHTQSCFIQNIPTGHDLICPFFLVLSVPVILAVCICFCQLRSLTV